MAGSVLGRNYLSEAIGQIDERNWTAILIRPSRALIHGVRLVIEDNER
jgi:hypothetical protein